MPITKIFYRDNLICNPEKISNLAIKIEKMLLQGFNAPKGITGEVIFIPTSFIHFGKNLYIEVDCRQEEYYQQNNLNHLAENLANLVKSVFQVENKFKVRILSFDSDRIFWWE